MERGTTCQAETPPAPTAVFSQEQMVAKVVLANLSKDPDGRRIVIQKTVVELKSTYVTRNRDLTRMFMQLSN
jgi:hypothetical protein